MAFANLDNLTWTCADCKDKAGLGVGIQSIRFYGVPLCLPCWKLRMEPVEVEPTGEN